MQLQFLSLTHIYGYRHTVRTQDPSLHKSLQDIPPKQRARSHFTDKFSLIKLTSSFIRSNSVFIKLLNLHLLR